MTTVLSLARQASEIDDSSEGGFQFSHPLFASSITPARTLEESRTAVLHTSPTQGQHEQCVLTTPIAQPAYSRFSRRLPLGSRSSSSDGQPMETPAQVTAPGLSTKPPASSARWKRTGRIGLGPPKRAERQSLEPDGEALSMTEHLDLNKENEPPIAKISSLGSDDIQDPTHVSSSIRQRSTSPQQTDLFSHSADTEHSTHSQESANTKKAPQTTYPSPVDVSDHSLPSRSFTHLSSKESEAVKSKQLFNAEVKPQDIGGQLKTQLHPGPPIPNASVGIEHDAPLIHTVSPVIGTACHSLVPFEVKQRDALTVAQPLLPMVSKPNDAAFNNQVPPPKMSLDGPAPTATRKAKTLGRIVMNGREYTRLDQIGKGGSSKVFRVMAPNGKIFALKRVDFEQADQATIAGYKSEIDLLKKMSASTGSERIIKLFDAEINDTKGRLLMLMEAGEIDLAHMLTKRQKEPLDFNFVRLFWRHMLEAVQAVHDQKIVHSDLKPANFLLVEGSLKLIDFGIAKAIGNDTTNIHRDQQVGTVNYMSPEALSDTGGNAGRLMKLGRASDVWSLGCILYQMVYGRTPFSHLSMIQKIQAIPNHSHRIDFPLVAFPSSTCNDTVKDESVARIVDGDLLRVMRGCLERDQTLRLTIAQLLEDPFLRPEEKVNRPLQSGTVSISLDQITELLRITVAQTREKTLQKEAIHHNDIEHLAKDFFDRLRWTN